MSARARLFFLALLLGAVGCCGGKPKPPLPGGLPPEYEPPRSFDLPGESKPAAPEATPEAPPAPPAPTSKETALPAPPP
jgi:hypothetical protein